ncbi:hypothetical protein [Limnothrix sp. PR1529]|uniref:hypothetical protein n=1 Tax=Limnothrix sp. PR1529 TaxID=1704291 RepID=UPI0013045231|nr:hypothetical protein [Limnothrix sp. PR1529]
MSNSVNHSQGRNWRDRLMQICFDRSGRSPWPLLWSLAIAALYGSLSLHQGFSGEFVVQDDARQHVFWMQRFLNPSLFHNDLIADYFESIAPIGYTKLYQLAAFFQINPLIFNKLLPPILGLIITFFTYRVTFTIFPVPVAGFLATVLLNQSLWLKDDLVSGTSRAFAFPLFLAVLDGLARKSPQLLWSSIALQGLICPTYALVSGGLISLKLAWVGYQKLERAWLSAAWTIRNPSDLKVAEDLALQKSDLVLAIQSRLIDAERQQLFLYIGALGSLFLVLLPVLFLGQDFGPVVSEKIARTMPEFLDGGRTNIFDRDWIDYWFFGRGTNLIPRSLLTPVTLIFGFALPLFQLSLSQLNSIQSRFPLSHRITPEVNNLWQLGLASIGWFLLAHGLLFRLHLPSRYTGHSFRIIIAIAAAISLVIVWEALQRWAGRSIPNFDSSAVYSLPPLFNAPIAQAIRPKPKSLRWKVYLSRSFSIILIVLVLGYPLLVPTFPANSYQTGRAVKLYQFLQGQPTDIKIASLSSIGDDIPTFAGRSILTGKEYAVPYHLGYYRLFRERILRTIEAQYSTHAQSVKFFLARYHISFWLIDRAAFSENYLKDSWLEQYPETSEPALQTLRQGQTPLVQSLMNSCAVLQDQTWVLLDAQCLRDS